MLSRGWDKTLGQNNSFPQNKKHIYIGVVSLNSSYLLWQIPLSPSQLSAPQCRVVTQRWRLESDRDPQDLSQGVYPLGRAKCHRWRSWLMYVARKSQSLQLWVTHVIWQQACHRDWQFQMCPTRIFAAIRGSSAVLDRQCPICKIQLPNWHNLNSYLEKP